MGSGDDYALQQQQLQFQQQQLQQQQQQQQHMAITPAMTMRTVAVQQEDMNPLKPCGACTEWLKKIAEVNPSFMVLSFTDESCTGVYVESIFDS